MQLVPHCLRTHKHKVQSCGLLPCLKQEAVILPAANGRLLTLVLLACSQTWPPEHYCQAKRSQNACWHSCSGLHDLVRCSRPLHGEFCTSGPMHDCMSGETTAPLPDILAAVGNDLHLLVLGHAGPRAQLPPRLWIQGQPLIPLLQPQHLHVIATTQGSSMLGKHWYGHGTQQPPCLCSLGQPLVSNVCSVQPARVRAPGHRQNPSESKTSANSKTYMSYHTIHCNDRTCRGTQMLLVSGAGTRTAVCRASGPAQGHWPRLC